MHTAFEERVKMSYVAYIPHPDTYKNYFTVLGPKRKQKDFYVVRPAKTGNGDVPVVTVAPTQSDVARAQADIQRDREEHISQAMPVLAHLSRKRPRASNSKTTKPNKKRKI